jgi:hypothetical protein
VPGIVEVADSKDLEGRLIAFGLLDEVRAADAAGDAIIDHIFANMPAGHSNLRFTLRDRLAEADEAIHDLIVRRGPAHGVVRIHDCGASNAITSVNLFERLRHHTHVRLTASDLHTEMHLRRVAGWSVWFDDRGVWMQAVKGSVIVNRRVGQRCKTWLNKLLRLPVAATIARSAARRPVVKTIPLFHPAAIVLAKSDPRFSLARADILKLPPQSCDILRAMTVFFTWPAALKLQALHSACAAVADGGYLVIGEGVKDPEKNRCSIFRRQGNRMTHFRDVMNPASETADILALVIPTA